MDRRTFIGALGVTGTVALQAAHHAFADNLDELSELMPTFFIGHGSPLNAVEDNRFTRGWKEALQNVPPPKAIVCVSAHWLTRGSCVTAMSRPQTIHDHGLALRALNAVRYPAPGSRALAAQIAGAVRTTEVELDNHWGLDHATWSILRHAFPDADVPVLQLSIDRRRPASWHYNLGRELLSLRRRGVLVVGSGNIVHNPRPADQELVYDGFDWAIEANAIMKAKINAGEHAALCDYKRLGRSVCLAVPSPDHYYPLLYVLGMQTRDDKVTIFNDALAYGGVTMTSVRLSA